jgi:predicted ATPase
MEITRIIIENFKGIERVVLEPIRPINVLIGRNNSGKSSVLSIIALFTEYLKAESYNHENRYRFGSGDAKPLKTPIPKNCFSNNGKPIRFMVGVGLSDEDRQKIRSEIKQKWNEQFVSPKIAEDTLEAFFSSKNIQELHILFTASRISFSLDGIYLSCAGDDLNTRPQIIAKGNLYDLEIRNFLELLTTNQRVPPEVKIKQFFEKKEEFIRQVSQRPEYQIINETLFKKVRMQLFNFFQDTFYVSPFRHGLENEIPQQADRLTNNGENLVRYLHSIALNDNNAFRGIADFVRGVLPEVGRLHPRFTGKEDQTIELAYDWPDGHSVNLSNMGGGVEQLLILGSLLLKQQTAILLWEEPENHLHPGAQERLLDLIEEYVCNCPIFLTTHSPVFIRASEKIAVHAIYNPDGKKAVSRVLMEGDLHEASLLIGSRPSHLAQADIIVYVEGIYGAVVIEEWIKKWPSRRGTIKTLQLIVQPFNVSEVGSDDFDIEKLIKVNPNILFFVDNDADETSQKETNDTRKKLKRLCDKHNIPCIITDYENNRRQIEDFFTLDAIKEGLPSNLRKNIPSGFRGPMRDLFQGCKWKRYNRKIAAAMKWEHISQYKELGQLFDEISKIAERFWSDTRVV